MIGMSPAALSSAPLRPPWTNAAPNCGGSSNITENDELLREANSAEWERGNGKRKQQHPELSYHYGEFKLYRSLRGGTRKPCAMFVPLCIDQKSGPSSSRDKRDNAVNALYSYCWCSRRASRVSSDRDSNTHSVAGCWFFKAAVLAFNSGWLCARFPYMPPSNRNKSS